MVPQRDQVTVWERFLKCHLDEIESVSFNLGDFGLARAADDLVHSLAGQRPNLSPWKSYWAMGLCPDTPRKAVYTPPGFRWAQRGLFARGPRARIFVFTIKCLISGWNCACFVLSSDGKVGCLRWCLTSPDNLLISTSGHKFWRWSLHTSCSASWFKTWRVISACNLFRHGTEDTV